jgi:hypothetical protein
MDSFLLGEIEAAESFLFELFDVPVVRLSAATIPPIMRTSATAAESAIHLAREGRGEGVSEGITGCGSLLGCGSSGLV